MKWQGELPHLNHEAELLLTSVFSLSYHSLYTSVQYILTLQLPTQLHVLSLFKQLAAKLYKNLCYSRIQPTAIALNNTIQHIRNGIQ